jgi:hypothetical protein
MPLAVAPIKYSSWAKTKKPWVNLADLAQGFWHLKIACELLS